MNSHEKDKEFLAQLDTLCGAMARVSTKQAIDRFAADRIEQWYMTKITRDFQPYAQGDVLDCVVLTARCFELADSFQVSLEPCTGGFGAGRVSFDASVKGLSYGRTIELEPRERWRFIRKLLLEVHAWVYEASRR